MFEYTQFEMILFYLGVGSTLFFLGQLTMLIGIDGHGDVSHDLDFDHESDSSFRIFTLKNIVGFLVGISWGTLSLYREFGMGQWASLALGTITGFVIMIIQFTIFWVMMKLDGPNAESTQVTVGTNGEVYLPFNDKGLGKIQITLNGAMKTVTARVQSEQTSTFKTGDAIIVTEVIGGIPYVSPVGPVKTEKEEESTTTTRWTSAAHPTNY